MSRRLRLAASICVVVAIALIIIFELWRTKTTISTGMKMQVAVAAMKEQGLLPQQMAYATAHAAFDMADGRTIVLIGDATVTDIQIIANPNVGKAGRKTTSVTTLAF